GQWAIANRKSQIANRPTLAAPWLPADLASVVGPSGLSGSRQNRVEPGRSVSMALVEALGAFLLLEAAAHRVRAIPRHAHLGRQRIRCPVFCAGDYGGDFLDFAEIFCA